LLLELELELLLEFELELLLELELELLLWFELELLLELELELPLWFELELLLWLELELPLWFELELLFRFELAVERLAEARFSRLIVRWFLLIARRFWTARARHHSIDFPSIFRSTGTGARAALSETGATVARPSSDRDGRESRAPPRAMPMAPSAPA
jgi:hypothetical protein